MLLLRQVLRARGDSLTRLGLGPGGVTMEFAAAKLNEAVAKSDVDTSGAIGAAAKQSVLNRLRSHSERLERARILWVDDHPENNDALVELLRRFGATVDLPRSNAEALSLLRNSRYDVIISDVARDDEGPHSDLMGVELAREVFEGWRQQIILFHRAVRPRAPSRRVRSRAAKAGIRRREDGFRAHEPQR